MTPIWKDYIVDLTEYAVSDDGVSFSVYTGATLVYTGKAYPNPETGKTEARLNDILMPLLFTANAWGPSGGVSVLYKQFTVEAYDSVLDVWVEVLDDYVTPDWSYIPDYNPLINGCNHPILGSYEAGQLVPLSFVGEGTHTVYIDSVVTVGDFNGDYNNDYLIGTTTRTAVSYSGDTAGHAHWLDLASYPNAVDIEVDGIKYPVVRNCNRYLLYYINAFGYWDSFPVYCKTKETDKLTRHTYKKDYDNRKTYNRGTVNQVNEIAHQYTFYTAWMTEAQSLLMPHLLNATTVYLKDNLRGEVLPLVLTNSTTELKQGGQLYQYTIDAQLAQERIRR